MWFQTKSLTTSMNRFVINNSGQFTYDGIFLKDFSGTFEIYAFEDEWWLQLYLTIEHGMLTNLQTEYIEYYNGFKINFQKVTENIQHSSIDYLRRIIETNEKNRNRF
jgi:hypothetical protein